MDFNKLMKEIDVNYNTKHILIVDENNKLKSVLNSVFDSKYKIVSINSGKEAWYFIQKEIPDLIISDVLMAEMNGLELCELVKSTFDTAHIPVILFTTLSDKKKAS